MQKGQPRFSAGTEIAAEAEMDSRKNAVKNVTTEILTAEMDNLCAGRRALICEQRDNWLCGELNRN